MTTAYLRPALFSFLIYGMILALASSCESSSKPSTTDSAATVNTDSIFLAYGQTIAGQTFQQLSGRLQAAMKNGGVQNAVQECQLAASPLVDSLSAVFQAEIRRSALKVRNPANAASPQEKAVLLEYQEQMDQGEKLQPQLHDLGNGQVAFYAPIIAADLCLKCHGKVGETLQAEDYAFIQSKYPADEAIGFTAGDLRGIWSISFAKAATLSQNK